MTRLPAGHDVRSSRPVGSATQAPSRGLRSASWAGPTHGRGPSRSDPRRRREGEPDGAMHPLAGEPFDELVPCSAPSTLTSTRFPGRWPGSGGICLNASLSTVVAGGVAAGVGGAVQDREGFPGAVLFGVGEHAQGVEPVAPPERRLRILLVQMAVTKGRRRRWPEAASRWRRGGGHAPSVNR